MLLSGKYIFVNFKKKKNQSIGLLDKLRFQQNLTLATKWTNN